MTKNKKKLISILLTGSVFSTTISNNIFVSATESQDVSISKEEKDKALKLFKGYDKERNQERMKWLFEHETLKKSFIEAVKKELKKDGKFSLKSLKVKFMRSFCSEYKFLYKYFFNDKEIRPLIMTCVNEVIIAENGEVPENGYFDNEGNLNTSFIYTIKEEYKNENPKKDSFKEININEKKSDEKDCKNDKINKSIISGLPFLPEIEKNKNLSKSTNFGNSMKIDDKEKIQNSENVKRSNSITQNIDNKDELNNPFFSIKNIYSDVGKLDNKPNNETFKNITTFFAVGAIIFFGLNHFAELL